MRIHHVKVYEVSIVQLLFFSLSLFQKYTEYVSLHKTETLTDSGELYSLNTDRQIPVSVDVACV